MQRVLWLSGLWCTVYVIGFQNKISKLKDNNWITSSHNWASFISVKAQSPLLPSSLTETHAIHRLLPRLARTHPPPSAASCHWDPLHQWPANQSHFSQLPSLHYLNIAGDGDCLSKVLLSDADRSPDWNLESSIPLTTSCPGGVLRPN